MRKKFENILINARKYGRKLKMHDICHAVFLNSNQKTKRFERSSNFDCILTGQSALNSALFHFLDSSLRYAASL